LKVLIDALRLDHPRPEALQNLAPDEWRSLLAFADREHLTLELGLRLRDALPADVRDRVDRNLADNARRYDLARQTYSEIAARLDAENIPYVVLKGFSHWPCYARNPRHRPQYDLDFLCLPHDVHRARLALESIGYHTARGQDKAPVDHLPTMIRWRDWRWRGDYFDPQAPLNVELHYRLWDQRTERIRIDGLQHFWERRTLRWVEDFCFPALDRVDTVAYAAFHLMRHVLRGDAPLRHAHELACFLDATSDDAAFWERWSAAHSESARRLQTIAFRLVASWFGCQLPPAVVEESQLLAPSVRRWFDVFALAPVDAKIRPNKSELWLHLSLLESASDKATVLRRRLFPMPRLRTVDHAFGRLGHHLRAWWALASDAWTWRRPEEGLGKPFLQFLAACALFNFGIAAFFLLYNLHLMGRGFHEDLIGEVASAMSVGSIAGALPAPFILQRFGLHRTLVATFLLLPLVCVARVLVATRALLAASAFAGGFLFSMYAVMLPVAVAQLTAERARRLAFSMVFAAGIGVGVLANLIGGQLPSFLSMQNALLACCGLATLGALVLGWADFSLPAASPRSERRVYPFNGFILRFLAAILIWNLATGACNPFFNVYFAKELQRPVGEIGKLFSAAQIVQVLAVLGAPAVLRRLGLISGVASMQLATALALGALALGLPGVLAGAAYAAYMAFQYMSEPGIYSLLMERVRPEERSGASAMNFVVLFGGQALAAAVAGVAVQHFGYRIVLAVAGVTAVIAGLLFRVLLRGRARAPERKWASALPARLLRGDSGRA